MAKMYGLKITMPKFGISGSSYTYDPETRSIAKGVSSIKGLGEKDADELLTVASGVYIPDNFFGILEEGTHGQHKYRYFADLLHDIKENTSVNSGKIDTLIHIDFFDSFGNQRELENIVSVYDRFADRKKLKADEVEGSRYEEIIRAHSTNLTKSGKPAAQYTIEDNMAIIRDCEDRIKSLNLPDFSLIAKVKYFADVMGYSGYTTGRDEDMKKLYIKEVMPLKRKSDGKQFGYSVITQSIGSGKEARFTLFNREFDLLPVTKGDIIRLIDWSRDKGMYFTLRTYTILSEGDMSEVKELA